MTETPSDPADLPEALDQALKFDDQGLIAAIAQSADSGEILMVAWMNRQSLAETLRTGRVCYWSRSRQKLWRKGESSGQIQELRALRIDCDGDSLLLSVKQTGVACHTGRRSCFFRELDAGSGQLNEVLTVEIDPNQLYDNN